MNTNRDCGCKSFRTCLICENMFNLTSNYYFNVSTKFDSHLYYDVNKNLLNNEMKFPGVLVVPNFISEEEETKLVSNLDTLEWTSSQSGRRKQNFGPKVNFKKKKLKIGNFTGFPSATQFIQKRFKNIDILKSFQTIEQCSIEYRPETGSCIEPHVDDCWIWGERIVQLNLLSSSILSFVPFSNKSKYNLDEVSKYPKIVDINGKCSFNPPDEVDANNYYKLKSESDLIQKVVNVPLIPRSLLILYGEARYNYQHFILRENINSRRIVIAYREFTPPYLPYGEHYSISKEILTQSKIFW